MPPPSLHPLQKQTSLLNPMTLSSQRSADSTASRKPCISSTAIIAVSDISQGYIEVNNSPHTRRVKTVFLAMRHAIDDMAARQLCMDTMRELFRQFMSKLILEKTKQEQHNIYLDSRISFQEIDQYFFSGCACAFFQIAVDTYTDLRYDPTEWQ